VDHFPRRPVFPGTLLMNASLQLAVLLSDQFAPPAAGGRWELSEVTNMKLRTFIPPGETLAIDAVIEDVSARAACVKVRTRNANRGVGVAQVHFVPKGDR
jgi:3-hydroxymyristoyl/3-hydroxydecanoyl-(acyl carrier protein) dehydratase